MQPRPNLLWICTEHQRFDTVHALGNEHLRTPNLDRLAREGVAFTHAFAQNSVCTPSRSSFLTGRYPVTTRCRQNGQNLPHSEILITRTLAEAGYDCGLVGKLHVSAAASGSERRINDGYRAFHWSHGATARHGGEWVDWLAEQGLSFDEIYRPSPLLFSREVTSRAHHQTTWCFDRALDFMRQPRPGPWLVSVNPFAAHDPFDYLPEYLARYDPASLPAPAWRPGELDRKPPLQRAACETRGYESTTAEQRREMKAAYYATLEHLDAELGRLLDWLDETGTRDNTLIIFHADHGDMGGDHGIFGKGPYLYDPAVRVPLLLSWPGVLPTGSVCPALVELVDLAPTIHDLLGLPIPDRMQGRPLTPLFAGAGPPTEFRSGVYSEYYNSNPPRHLPGGEGAYLTMWRTREHKLVVHHGRAWGELYDLRRDPGEFDNRWDDPDYAEIRLEMMQQCFDARVFTMDPLPPRVDDF